MRCTGLWETKAVKILALYYFGDSYWHLLTSTDKLLILSGTYRLIMNLQNCRQNYKKAKWIWAHMVRALRNIISKNEHYLMVCYAFDYHLWKLHKTSEMKYKLRVQIFCTLYPYFFFFFSNWVWAISWLLHTFVCSTLQTLINR